MNAWIGLGGNIGDSAAKIGAALASIRNHRDIRIVRSSALYRSEPWGRRQQAPFTNAVAELDTALTPRELLVELANLELQLGRVPDGRRWGPRVIDLDILLVGDRIIVLEDLVVPHPRMHRRAFVLAPLDELQPDLFIPGRGTVRACLARLPDQGVRRL